MILMILMITITSSYHDSHDYASSAFPVGSNGTVYEKAECNDNADDHHYASADDNRHFASLACQVGS